MKLEERTEKEKVAYIMGQYFIGKITLNNLRIQIEVLNNQ